MDVSARSAAQSSRRTKRTIPDTEKDETYWEKRKRNNIAAKRSRENKRQYENLVRGRVFELEEENALLRKELEVIKAQFNIPKDVCVLSPSERNECIDACWSNRLPKIAPEPDVSTIYLSDNNVRADCASIKGDVIETSTCTEQSETSGNKSVWAITPAHSRSLQCFAESSEIYRNERDLNRKSDTAGCSDSVKRKLALSLSTDDIEPTDLSTKRHRVTNSERNIYLDLDLKQSMESSSSKKMMQPKDFNSLTENSSTNSEVDQGSTAFNEIIDFVGPTDPDSLTNSEIKNKLQILSDQVQRMQKLVCDT